MKFFVERVFGLIRTYGFNKPYSVRNITNVASKDILRSTAGRLSLVSDDSTASSFLPLSGSNFNVLNHSNSDKITEIYEIGHKDDSPPVIDINTFKNYLMVPPLGLTRFFNTEMIKMCENKDVLYKQYVPGSLVAHNYPLTILPVCYARRIHPDVYVKTFMEDHRNYKIASDGRKIKLSLSPGLKIHDSYPLLHKLCGNLSLLFIFSGDLPNCQYNSVQRWLNYPRLFINDPSATSPASSAHKTRTTGLDSTNLADAKNKIKVAVVLNAPSNRLLAWAYNRYLETLARSVVEENRLMAITRRLGVDATIALHQYRKQLPSVLLVDRSGYIRWHAIGYPTVEAVTILNNAIRKLLSEV